MGIFSWPLVVLIIVVFALILFRKPISDLIPKIRSLGIGKTGLETHSPQLLQKEQEKKSPAEEMMRAFDNKLLLDREDIIKKDLESKVLNQGEMLNVLIRHLAMTQLTLRFEYLNSLIWGSQIEILQNLNSSPHGMTVELIKPRYDFAADIYSVQFANYSFEKYLDFLISNILIVNQDNRYFITVLGREFLTFLVQTGRTGFRVL